MSDTPTIATIGEILVEFVSHQKNCGLAKIGTYSGPYPSGAPAIFLDQAARMGAPTQLIGGVGADGFGQVALERLKADGVGTDGVTVSTDHSTGVAFVTYYDTGARDFIFHLTGTAADQFAVPDKLLDPGETFLHVSAASLGNGTMRDAIITTMRRVVAAGGRVSCDPNARPELMRDSAVRAAVQEVMQNSICLLPSVGDLEFLYPGLSENAAIDKLSEGRAEFIAVKRGAGGATVIAGCERFELPGHAVKEVDPTGAGDCFGGTFVALLAQGASPQEAGAVANAAGALAVTRRGPMEGNAGPAEIAAFRESQRIGTQP